jgi:hypothetical protein
MSSLAQSATEKWLLDEYGALIDLANTAKLLGYKNPSALAKARSRGTLPFVMVQIPHRRGWWTTSGVLAAYLQELPQVCETIVGSVRSGDGGKNTPRQPSHYKAKKQRPRRRMAVVTNKP